MSQYPIGSVLEYAHGTYKVVDRKHPSEILPGDDSTDYRIEAVYARNMDTGAREWLHESDMGDPDVTEPEAAQ